MRAAPPPPGKPRVRRRTGPLIGTPNFDNVFGKETQKQGSAHVSAGREPFQYQHNGPACDPDMQEKYELQKLESTIWISLPSSITP